MRLRRPSTIAFVSRMTLVGSKSPLPLLRCAPLPPLTMPPPLTAPPPLARRTVMALARGMERLARLARRLPLKSRAIFEALAVPLRPAPTKPNGKTGDCTCLHKYISCYKRPTTSQIFISSTNFSNYCSTHTFHLRNHWQILVNPWSVCRSTTGAAGSLFGAGPTVWGPRTQRA